MPFNIGELQGTIGIDDSGVDGGLSSVLDKITGFAGRGGAAAAAAGAAIGAGLAIAIAAAFESDTVTRKIQATLGATEKDAARYGKAAGSLFSKNYGESLDEVGSAISSVVKNIGGMGDVSNDVLESITGQVLSLSKVFDEDLGAVTRSVGQLMKTGLAANAQEALDIVTKGLQSPVNAADDLLDTFDEYSTIFRSIGLDGKDALGVLSQGLQAGARDADVVADSLKEMLLRLQAGDSRKAITDLGLNFEQALGQVSKGGDAAKATFDVIIDRLNAVEDPATRSSIAVGIFGTKAEDMQKAIAGIDIDSAATEFESAYGKINGAAQELDATVGGSLQGSFETLWRSLQGTASAAGEGVAPFIRIAADALSFLFGILQGGIQFVMDLPGPLFAIGAAVAVWASWSTIAAGAVALQAAIVGIGVAARGMLVSLGPIGLLLIGITTAMAFLTDESDRAESALADQKTRFDDLKASLDSATGAITENTRATVLQQAQATGVADTLRNAGISLDLYADAATGNAQAQEELARQITAAQTAALGSDGAFKSLAGVLDGAKVSQEDLATAIRSGDWSTVTSQVSAYADSVARQSGNTGDATSIMDQFTAAMQQAQGPVNQLDGVLLQAGEATDQLKTAQADAATTAGDFGNSAEAAFDRIMALATVSGLSADEIQRMGTEAGLSAPQIDAIKAAADGATAGASPLAQALQDGASASSEFDAALQLLQIGLDTLAGNTISAEQASRAHEATIRAVAAAARDRYDADVAQAEAQAKVNELTAAGTSSGSEYDAATRALTEAQAAAADASDKQADSLDQLADSAQGMTQRAFDGAGGMSNYEAAVVAATGKMTEQRAQFIESAKAAGVGEVAAEQLADAQGLIPGNVRTAYDAIRAKEAADAAGGVAGAVNSIPSSKTSTLNANDLVSGIVRDVTLGIANIPSQKTVTIQVVQQGIAQVQQAINNINPFRENGGVVHAADGRLIGGRGTSTVMDGRGAGLTWAEQATGKEYYISMKSGQETRNRGFASQAVDELGGMAIWPSRGGGGGGGGTQVFDIRLQLDGDVLDRRTFQVVDGRLTEVAREYRREKARTL
ncbi:phage tail tape measure protein [Nakamurella flava]|uniref:Phage tail tape measure protein n=1 Tax=Nakamurella flava TaxID=2576308 RepID=A0A4U6QN48_9ACTN|nr:phage tail tape measure protein [Nakamurella flava]TKV61871.1 phage tail tape measure protein [Nakamurella flava]